MSNPQRSIRLLGRAESSLNNISGTPGEIFYDTTNQTLRVYNRLGPSVLATEDYVDTAVNNIDLSGIDLSGLDLTGYATETYVTTRGYITSSALSSYALTSAIPTNTNQLTNGAGFITSSALSSYALTSAIPTNNNQLTNGANYITSSALSGYALTSAIPTNNNQLTNGAGYITSSSLTGLATETFVGTAISNLIDTAPTALNTLNELAAALNDDANFATTVTTALGDKAPINNPTFTGTVGGVTATHVGLGNVTNESKATMFTTPTFTGTKTAISSTTATSSSTTGALTVAGGVGIAGDLFVGGAIAGYAPLDSPIFEGTAQLQSATFTGTVTMQQTVEKFVASSVVAGAVALNFTQAAIFVVTPDISNFTADFSNIPGTAGRTISTTLIITQGATPYIPNAVKINGGSSVTPKWLGGSAPTGTANRTEIVSFTMVCTATNTWTVLGSLSSFG